jgi:putative phage-type endonuclease
MTTELDRIIDRAVENAPAVARSMQDIIDATPDRSSYLGSSDVAAIMGLSPWKTPLQCYLDKINGQAATDTPVKQKLYDRGHRWEPIACDYLLDDLEERFGKRPIVTAINERYTDKVYPFMRAEIDREFLIDGEHVNVELKTVHSFAVKKWGAVAELDEELTDEVPIHYAAQAAYGLGITLGRQRTIIGALIGADNLLPYELKRDQETIEGIRERCARFWLDNVMKRVPPAPVNMDDILLLFAKTNGRPIELSEKGKKALERLRIMRDSVKMVKDEIEECKLAIADEICAEWSTTIDEVKDNALIMCDGVKVATWNKQSRTNIDVKQLRAKEPEIAKKYGSTSWTRVLRLSKPKD